ncbi:hypothetical protein AB1283_26160 [Bacillus sp. S13(2024)]|uniref:hypothetical protein n=1 Tax=Bacillus sp. S13(2024) TaxID=3162885 RepID=UPI003D1D0EC9
MNMIFRVKQNHYVVTSKSVAKATPEEIKQEKRRRIFDSVGRQINQFKEGDIVHEGDKILMEVSSVDVSFLPKIKCKWWDSVDAAFTHTYADIENLHVVYFAENMVKEDE